MSVEVTNETEWIIDPKVFSDLGVWVLDQMRVSTQSDLAIMFVDPEPIATLHERWMNLQGPTDVMSFPMDELRPGDGRTVVEGVLGDIVICPWVAAQQAAAAGHSTMEEMMLLTIHGILHLLGYDHRTPEQERQMFGSSASCSRSSRSIRATHGWRLCRKTPRTRWPSTSNGMAPTVNWATDWKELCQRNCAFAQSWPWWSSRCCSLGSRS